MKIGLVPISAKPYHRGHHALVELAASQNQRVLLMISISDRIRKNEFPIIGSAMHDVWLQELEQILPSNVSVSYGGSPVRKVYEIIEQACTKHSKDIYRIYSDPADTAANYALNNRKKYMSPMCDIGQVIFVAEENPDSMTRGVGTPNIQGKDLRNALKDNDLSLFASLLPAGVNAQAIFDILRSEAGVSEVPKLAEVFFGGIF
jgi:hypothetical protein